MCNALNKSSYMWRRYKRLYKYEEYRNKKHKFGSCTKKNRQIGEKDLYNGLLDSGKIIPKTCCIAINDNLFLLKFTNILPYLPASSRPNITNCFQLLEVLQLSLQNLLSLLKPVAWAKLFNSYPGFIQIYLLMILCFGA